MGIQEECGYYVEEILKKHKIRPCLMANRYLADEVEKELKKRGYDPAVIRFQNLQYIAVTQRAKEMIAISFEKKEEELWKELEEIERCRKEIDAAIGGRDA